MKKHSKALPSTTKRALENDTLRDVAGGAEPPPETFPWGIIGPQEPTTIEFALPTAPGFPWGIVEPK